VFEAKGGHITHIGARLHLFHLRHAPLPERGHRTGGLSRCGARPGAGAAGDVTAPRSRDSTPLWRTYQRIPFADYDRAIALFPDRPDKAKAYTNRGNAYYAKGDLDRAIADFRKVLEVSDDPTLRGLAEETLRELGVTP